MFLGLPFAAETGIDKLGEFGSLVLGWASPERSYPRFLVEAAGVESGHRFLDVGCGAGVLLACAAFKEPGAVLVGLDPDQDALEVAARNLAGSGARVELQQGAGEELPFAEATFDVVALTMVLHRLAAGERQRTLGECARVLKPGGRLLVAEWTDDPSGAAALLALPSRAIRGLLGSDPGASRVRDQITLAGFEPPSLIASFRTLYGIIDAFLAYAPTLR